MIKIDAREIRELERDLKVFAKKAMPYATRNTLTGTAFYGRKMARSIMGAKFTLRNKHFQRGVRVTPARGINIRSQQAALGHIDPEGRRQEFGDTIRDPAIATQYSAGQRRYQIPRTRLTRAPHKLKRIQAPVKQKSRSKQHLVAAVREAAARKTPSQRYAVLRTRRGQQVFKILGGKRKPTLQSVADVSRDAVKIPPRPWLAPAVKLAQRESPRIYLKSLQYQARRNRLFGYRKGWR